MRGRWCKCDVYFSGDTLKCPRCGMTGPPESEEEYERREWKEWQEDVRKEHQANPLRYYCYKITGKVPDYEISFEENQADVDENRKFRNEKSEKHFEQVNEEALAWKIRRGFAKPPEGTTKTKWLKEHAKKRKLRREKLKQEVADDRLRYNSPINILPYMFEKIQYECECEAPKMRAGKFCKICVLATRVRQYTLDLFKDAAEGRSSYV